MVTKSAEAAVASATEMRQAVAGTSVVEPMPSLGENGFTYQPKKDNGQIDRTSMFFYGHRGTVNVSGYLNLKDAITPAQRDLAANLLAGTLRVASNPKALAKEANCRYLDPNLVKRLLPADDMATIVPDANNCVVSAGGRVITVAITREARDWATAERLLKSGGCTVDMLPNLGKVAGIAHHCRKGNPRAEVLFVTGSRTFRLLYAPAAEPSADDRAALVDLARVRRGKMTVGGFRTLRVGPKADVQRSPPSTLSGWSHRRGTFGPQLSIELARPCPPAAGVDSVSLRLCPNRVQHADIEPDAVLGGQRLDFP